MKIGIITYHRALNYGAVLQAYALKETLKTFGCDASVIDYRNSIMEKNYRDSILAQKTVKNKLKCVSRKLKNRVKKRKFEEFRDKYLISDKRIFKETNVSEANAIYDKFVVGSDQVWNPDGHGFDKNFYLNFVSDDSKKHSYAASFGVEEVDEQYKPELGSMLKKYSVCSVRETAGQKIINDLCDVETRVDIDPVFLMTKDQWNTTFELNKEKQKYAVMYYFCLTPVLKNLAKTCYNSGYEVIVVGKPAKSPFDFPVTFKGNIGPIDFLKLIFNSSFLITNSFHGTSFASIFNIPFATELLLGKTFKVNSRLTNILNTLDLNSRLIDEKTDLEALLKNPVNWEKVNMKIESLKDNSLSYIKELIKNE